MLSALFKAESEQCSPVCSSPPRLIQPSQLLLQAETHPPPFLLHLARSSFEKSPSDKWKMKGEVLLLIISVALTVIVFVLIAFIKKFIRSRPPGRRLVTSDIQVRGRYFLGIVSAISIIVALTAHLLVFKRQRRRFCKRVIFFPN